MGISISVPRNATVRDEQVDLTTSFSEAYEMPAGVESVSPAYSIETSKKVEFSKDVEVKLQHNASLETAEDHKDMVVLKSSQSPSQGTSQVGMFEEVDRSKVEIGPHWAVLKVKSFVSSVFKIGKKKDKYKSKGECWWGQKHHPLVLLQQKRRSSTQQGCTRQWLSYKLQLCFVCALSSLSTLGYGWCCYCVSVCMYICDVLAAL